MGYTRTVTDKQIEQIRALYKSGIGTTEISKGMQISYRVVAGWIYRERKPKSEYKPPKKKEEKPPLEATYKREIDTTPANSPVITYKLSPEEVEKIFKDIKNYKKPSMIGVNGLKRVI